MKIFDTNQTITALNYARLIPEIERLFCEGQPIPQRSHLRLANMDEPDATLLMMPAWSGQYGCVKIVNVTPGNTARSLACVCASVLVFDRLTGQHLALIDGAELTARRTVAGSALAVKMLAREDSEHLLLVGAGKIAAAVPEAFASVRSLKKVSIWARRAEAAEKLAASLAQQGFHTEAISDLETGVRSADIISAATLSHQPLIHGNWLKAGQHVDLIGAFTPTMREADDQALAIAKVYVDTLTALKESGELAMPLASGAIHDHDIIGDLYRLCQQKVPARQSSEEITLFKSVGNAAFDLAAASVCMELP